VETDATVVIIVILVPLVVRVLPVIEIIGPVIVFQVHGFPPRFASGRRSDARWTLVSGPPSAQVALSAFRSDGRTAPRTRLDLGRKESPSQRPVDEDREPDATLSKPPRGTTRRTEDPNVLTNEDRIGRVGLSRLFYEAGPGRVSD
jgi:hypothetical protein